MRRGKGGVLNKNLQKFVYVWLFAFLCRQPLMKIQDVTIKFPHLPEKILKKLNNESLFKSREVARSWKYFINGRNYPWLCVVNIPTILQIFTIKFPAIHEKGFWAEKKANHA